MAYGSLTASQLSDLARWGFPWPQEAALKAIEDPRFKRVFEDLGGVQVMEHDGRLYPVPSAASSESRFWDVVYAWAEGQSVDADEGREDAEPEPSTPGAKSRWRRADLETIFVKQPTTSGRKLVESGVLVEELHHQRISEVRKRGDVREENGRLKLPHGTTVDDDGWLILPKPG